MWGTIYRVLVCSHHLGGWRLGSAFAPTPFGFPYVISYISYNYNVGLLGLEWCLQSNISEVLGIGHRFSQGKGRRNLCSPCEGSLSLSLSPIYTHTHTPTHPHMFRVFMWWIKCLSSAWVFICVCISVNWMIPSRIVVDHEGSTNLNTIWCHWLQVLLNDGKTERVMLAHGSVLEASQEAVTEYRVLGPMINGCSWIELRPITSRKHQVFWTSYLSLLWTPALVLWLQCVTSFWR